ncbi:MAG: hypothetical protein ACRD4R_02180 [Candidatus Acidiferrales bacterium]
MRHFLSEQWADFVRKTLKKKDMQTMQGHLDNGCEQCKNDLAAWAHVSNLAGREAAYEPPSAAVKMAKAALTLHGQLRRSPVASLLFDSFDAPVTIGIRSSTAQLRQMLYGFGDYRVDLRFEPNLDTDQAVLVGQVLNLTSTHKSLRAITVALNRGGHILGTATTNEFGEFQLECDLGGQLELHFTLPGGEAVKLVIVEPSSESMHPGERKISAARRPKARRQLRSKSTRK